MKMTKLLMCSLVAVATAHATVIVDDDFSTHVDGDLNGQGDWVSSTNSAFILDSSDEVTMSLDASSLLLGGPNSISLMPGDSVKITIDHRYSMNGGVTPNYTPWSCGLQTTNVAGEGSAFTSWISYNGWANGRIMYFPDVGGWWNNNPREPSVWADCVDVLGNDPKPNVNPTPIPDTDDLQMIYEITKSDVTNELAATITLINSNIGFNQSATEVVSAADVWSASNLYFRASSLEGVANDCSVIIDRIKVEKLVPYKAPTGVIAIWPGANVELSWDHMAGAAEYDVFRSETSGSFGAALSRVSGESFVDTTAVGGTTYYYAVQAVYYNGNSVNSDEVVPEKIYVGESIADIGFTAGEGYVDADLAGQQGWEALVDSGSNAFNVITGTDNKADAVSSYANYDTANGNAVYLNKFIRNREDDALEGYVDVVVTAGTPAAGHNDFVNQSIMTFGLTSSTTDKHFVWGNAAQALFNLTIRNDGALFVTFNTPVLDNDDNRLARLDQGDLGWNPKAGGSRSTEPIRISFKLRKTRDEGVYQAWASMSNLTSGAVSEDHPFPRAPYLIDDMADIYDAEYGYFTCGLHPQALDEKSNGTNGPVHTALNNVNLSHTTNNLPVPQAPVIASAIGADRSVTLSWDDILDSTGYDVFMVTEGGDPYTVATNVSKAVLSTVVLEDSPRWNGITNTYTVRALFDGDVTSADWDSDPVSAVPQSLITVVDMDGSRDDLLDSTSGTFYLNQGGIVTNGSLSYLDRRLTPMIANGEMNSGITYNGYTIYGLTQNPHPDTQGTVGTRHYIENSGVGQRYYLSGGWGASSPQQLAYIEVADMDWEGAAPTHIDATDSLSIYLGLVSYTDGGGYMYPAIRNGEQWYVSDRGVRFNAGGTGAKDIRVSDAMAETWNMLSIDPETIMNPGSALGDNQVLNNITAVGWFSHQASYVCLSKFEVSTTGGTPSYEYWAGVHNLSGADADEMADPDGDGIVNKREFAYNGDPNVPGTAQLPEFDMTGTSHMGTDGFIYTYLESRDPVSGIAYDVLTTENLMVGPWSPSAHTVLGTEIIDYHWQRTTNFIPTTADQTFIKMGL